MKSDAASTEVQAWFPLFEIQDWAYRSIVQDPPEKEVAVARGAPVPAKVWGAGKFQCGQAFRMGEGGMAPDHLSMPGEEYSLSGTLVFGPNIELAVTIKGVLGCGSAPATFEGTGVGTSGALKGSISKLVGWVFPELPIQNGAARVSSVRGSVWAVRGTDSDPTHDPGGMAIDCVGSFVLSKNQDTTQVVRL